MNAWSSERMQAGEEVSAMNELLKELRNQRAYTIQNDLVRRATSICSWVQTIQQYLYIHRVMLCYFLEKHKARYESILNSGDNVGKYKKFVEEYNAATGTWSDFFNA